MNIVFLIRNRPFYIVELNWMRYVFNLIEMENKPVDEQNNENTITDELVIADHFY